MSPEYYVFVVKKKTTNNIICQIPENGVAKIITKLYQV